MQFTRSILLLQPLLLQAALFLPVRGELTFTLHTNDDDKNDDDACPLLCENGGSCEKSSQGEWECVCSDGFHGATCARRLQVCQAGTATQHTCLNGGRCIEHQEEYNSDRPICNCNRARDENGVRYFGRHCEIPVLPQDLCPGTNNTVFCMNGGFCRTQATNFHQRPCRCEPGYTGRHCDLSTEHVNECTLTCNNVGVCHHGVKGRQGVGAHDKVEFSGEGSKNYQYCECENGFTGTECEYEYTNCGGFGHYCFHGSTCSLVGQLKMCECHTANGLVAGDACQYRATDTCIDAGNPTGVVNLTNAQTNNPYCVNHGICVRDNTGYYCECDATKWTGNRCQIPVTPAPAPLATAPPTVWVTTSFGPTIMASITEFPTSTTTMAPTSAPSSRPSSLPTAVGTIESTADESYFSSSPSPSPRLDDGPPRISTGATAASTEPEELSGGVKFIVVMVVFGLVFGASVLVLRYHRRMKFAKESAGSHNLQMRVQDEAETGSWISSVPTVTPVEMPPLTQTEEEHGTDLKNVDII